MTQLWRFALLTAVACSAPKLQPAGGACLLTTDCQDGLVCVKQQRCSSDLSGIVNIEDATARVPPVPPAGTDSGDDASGSTDSAGAGDDASDANAASADDATQDVAAPE